jgi:uncharacterized membrane protein
LVARKKYIIALVAIVVLLAIGLWNIKNGEIVFGTSLIGASIGVGVMRHIKEKRIAKLRAQGVNPHDERTMHVAGLASTLTINIAIFTIAAIILAGSIIGPKTMVNLYDLLGFCLAGIVFIYIFAFYYYNRSN